MNNDDFDDLDRALFALPLEQPPPDLRAAILRVTVRAQTHAAEHASPFSTWEILGFGTALAIAVWFVLLVVWDRSVAVAVAAGATAFGHGLADPSLLTWLALGGAIATWFTVASSLPVVRRRS